jgi:hypothetical protein
MLLHTALGGLIALLATSCGNVVNHRGDLQVSTNGVQYGASADLGALSGSGSTTANGYSCPNSANVFPSDGNTYDPAGQYSVCMNTTDVSTILVHGQTRGSSAFCVFPIQYVDSSHSYWKPDPSTGLPMVSCANVPTASGSPGVSFTFSSTNYNAVIIVDDTNKDAMQTCLVSANVGGCPTYSYGKFR